MRIEDDGPGDAELGRLHEELEREFARVGVNWDAVEAAARGERPTPPAGVRQFTMLLEYGPALQVLRTLPDGSGTDAFLSALQAQKEERRRVWRTVNDRDV